MLESTPPLKLKILTINVWSGLDYKGYLRVGEYETRSVREKRYQALIIQIKDLQPDIIGINEANKLPSYARRMASDLGYDAFYHVGLGGMRLGAVGIPWNIREGDVILTTKDMKGRLVARQQLTGGYVGNFFTCHLGDATQILAVRIFHFAIPFYIFLTHWQADEITRTVSKNAQIQRVQESHKTLTFIQQIAHEHPFVLMGDFNATIDSGEIQKLLQFGMIDAFGEKNPYSAGYTWYPQSNLNHKKYYSHSTAKNFSARIDHILIRKHYAIELRKAHVAVDKIFHGVHASDHYGIFAEIELCI